jgi:hypothetical protein
MIIKLEKFGTTLVSRQSGKEAFLAFGPALESITNAKDVIIDFTGVITFSPSWGDEFITPIYKKYGSKLVLKNTSNSSVEATLKILEDINKVSFKKIN